MSKLGKIFLATCVIALIILVAARAILGGWINYLYIPMVYMVVAFLAAVIIDRRFYFDFLSMRTTKHGMNMGVLILMGLVLATAVNFLGVRYDKTFDLTKEKINSLSDQSVAVVKNLKEDLKVFIFHKGSELKEAARDIKNDFRFYTAETSRLQLRVVDANREPELAKKYLQNSEAFAVVLEYQGRRAVVQPTNGGAGRPSYQEKDITTALVKITREKPMSIYFVTGHGEKSIEQASIDGIKAFADLLKDEGYEVNVLNMVTDDHMPPAGSVIAIVGPRSPYAEKELEKLRAFARDGGRLLVAIDPGEKHQLALLTKSFGVEFRNNYVLNEVNIDEGTVGAVGVEFDSASPVTQPFARRQAISVFPFASELVKAPDAPTEYTYREIIKSHPRAYSAASASAKGDGADRRQHVLAMTVKSDKFLGLFFGDSDFLSDVRIARWIHVDLALNSVAYLFGDEANLTIRPKSLEATQLQITPTKGMTLALAGIGLPLVLIILSGFFWIRRRSL